MSNSFKTVRSAASGLVAPRVKQTLFILLACVSLVVSTFGACLCPHHKTESEEPRLSCHSTSHETEILQADTGTLKLDLLCICSSEASPAILNKSERKKFDGQTDVAAMAPPQFDPIYTVVISTPAVFSDRDSFQISLHRISAPSRAPPRL